MHIFPCIQHTSVLAYSGIVLHYSFWYHNETTNQGENVILYHIFIEHYFILAHDTVQVYTFFIWETAVQRKR